MKNDTLLENIAAISGEFHSQRDRYSNFYDAHGEDFEGFPGVYRFMVLAAKAFTTTEEELHAVWDAHNWPEAIEHFVDALYVSRNPAELTPKDLAALARTAILAA